MLLPEDTNFWTILLINLILGVTLLIMGFIYKMYPPKEINMLYGYRTSRTMANQQVWDYANKIGANMIIYWGIAAIIIGLLTAFLFPGYSIIMILAVTVLGCVFGMLWAERQLDKRFDKNGNRL